ncbi:MAG: hypothetical protein HYZ53_01860 [Planctomycetes bacterium]|nr:hypothetical protein [Planctomycetota bacterium]
MRFDPEDPRGCWIAGQASAAYWGLGMTHLPGPFWPMVSFGVCVVLVGAGGLYSAGGTLARWRREAGLCRNGAAVTGRVEGREVRERGALTRFYIRVAYRDAAGCERHERASVPAEDWLSFRRGKAVSILVEPTNTRRFVLYRAASFRVG